MKIILGRDFNFVTNDNLDRWPTRFGAMSNNAFADYEQIRCYRYMEIKTPLSSLEFTRRNKIVFL